MRTSALSKVSLQKPDICLTKASAPFSASSIEPRSRQTMQRRICATESVSLLRRTLRSVKASRPFGYSSTLLSRLRTRYLRRLTFVKTLTPLLRFAFGRGALPSAVADFDHNAFLISLLRAYHWLSLRPTFAAVVTSLRDSTSTAFSIFVKAKAAARELFTYSGTPAFTPKELAKLRTTLQALLDRGQAQFPEDTLTNFPSKFEGALILVQSTAGQQLTRQ